MALNYNVYPGAGYGSGTPYGMVPNPIGIPPSTYEQVASVYPNLRAQTGALSSNISNELAGQLSPQTIAALQQHAAQFGVQSGMPGSQFQGNQGLASLGLNTEAIQQQGQKDYLSALTGIGSTQTPQDLAASIAAHNADLAAAPNPQLAAEKQMADWMAKFNASAAAGRGGYSVGGGSPAGGTGSFSEPNYMNPPVVGGNDLSSFQKPGYTFDPQSGQYTAIPWDPLSYSGASLPKGRGYSNIGEVPSTYVSTNNYGIPNYYDIPGVGGDGTYDLAGTPMEGDISDPNSGWWD